jgi:hypothetical protein
MEDQPITRLLSTREITHTQTSMPGMGSEPTAPVFMPARTVHALNRAATALATP